MASNFREWGGGGYSLLCFQGWTPKVQLHNLRNYVFLLCNQILTHVIKSWKGKQLEMKRLLHSDESQFDHLLLRRNGTQVVSKASASGSSCRGVFVGILHMLNEEYVAGEGLTTVGYNKVLGRGHISGFVKETTININ